MRIDTAYPHTEVAGSLTDSQPKSTAAACSALFISSQYLSFPVTSAVILREEEKEEEKEEEEEEEEEGDDDEEEEARRAPLPRRCLSRPVDIDCRCYTTNCPIS